MRSRWTLAVIFVSKMKRVTCKWNVLKLAPKKFIFVQIRITKFLKSLIINNVGTKNPTHFDKYAGSKAFGQNIKACLSQYTILSVISKY